MTKIQLNNREIIYGLIRVNSPIILASSDHMIVFRDGVDISSIKEKYPEAVVEEDFQWKK